MKHLPVWGLGTRLSQTREEILYEGKCAVTIVYVFYNSQDSLEKARNNS